MYTEASLPRAHGDTATMYSEVIDISGLTNPELRFLNHMYGSAIGTLSVDLWDASTGTNFLQYLLILETEEISGMKN